MTDRYDYDDCWAIKPEEMVDQARRQRGGCLPTTKKIVIVLAVLTSALMIGIRQNSYWAVDATTYRQATLGDLTWAQRTQPDAGWTEFPYSEFHRTVLFAWMPLVSQSVVTWTLFALNTLAALYLLTKLTEIPYGFLIAITVGVKCFGWYAIGGNIGIQGAALAVAFPPLGAVVSAFWKPTGVLVLCCYVAHTAWRAIEARRVLAMGQYRMDHGSSRDPQAL